MPSNLKKIVPCKICNKNVRRRCLQNHLLTHKEKEERPFQCKFCNNFKARTIKILHWHQSVAHKITPVYTCIFCNKEHKTQVNLNYHLYHPIGERPFLCNLCPKEASSPQNLKTHKIRLHDPNWKPDFHCPICSKGFRNVNRGHYQAHLVRVHFKDENAKTHQCKICPMKFLTDGELQQHQKSVHSTERPYICNICEKRFAIKATLQVHLLVHSGERAHACNVCPERFKTKEYLKRHILTIHSKNRLKCKLCEKSYASKDGLKKHERTHGKERPHVCYICQKDFIQATNLKMHLRIHEGDRRYPCKICGKKFMTSGSRILHMRTHTGEKPFACGKCPQTFTNVSNLNVHLRKHADEM